MIEAQSKIAGDLGCKIIRDGVLTLSQNAETHLYQIQTMSGEFLFAKNVILATGKDMNLGKLNRGPDKPELIPNSDKQWTRGIIFRVNLY